MGNISNWHKKAAILAFWLLLWEGLSLLVQNPIFLVGPVDTARALWEQLFLPPFWSAVWFSLFRIFLGILLAFLAGILTGSLAYWKPLIGEFLAPAVQLMKSVPVASFVILALIWTGSENLSIFASFLVVYPVLHINTAAGLSSVDEKLLEMAQVFRVPTYKKIFFIYRGALLPYLASACRSVLGMGFKSGIAAEVIGVPSGSIGEGLYMAKIYLSTADLFAWTLVIIVISSLFEALFLAVIRTCGGKGAGGFER